MSTDSELFLIVDDDQQFRHCVASMSKIIGIECAEAECLDSAKSFLKNHSIHTVLSDMAMNQNEDGLALCKWCSSATPHIRFILMSGQPKPRNYDGEFLAKPFTLTQLKAILSQESA